MSGFFSSGGQGILKKDFTIKERRTAMISPGMIDLEFLRPGASFDEIFKFFDIAIHCRPRAIILHPWIYERSGYRQPVIDYHTLDGPAMLAFAVPEKRFCDHMHALEHPPHGQPKVKSTPSLIFLQVAAVLRQNCIKYGCSTSMLTDLKSV